MRKRKVNDSFKELLAELKSKSPERPKEIEKISQRQYFLIVCEGVRTEPIYFMYIQRLLPKNMVETIEVVGAGDNTINVVKKAIEIRDKRHKDSSKRKYDEVWAVFDKDDFPEERYNDAISLALINDIHSAYSNEAFELWYVLHFQNLTSAIKRGDYFKTLSQILKCKYKKKDEDVVKMLFEKGNVKRAIRWAKALDDYHTDASFAKRCPVTRVYLLVEKLLKDTKYLE